jgi:hypothetical protein
MHFSTNSRKWVCSDLLKTTEWITVKFGIGSTTFKMSGKFNFGNCLSYITRST